MEMKNSWISGQGEAHGQVVGLIHFEIEMGGNLIAKQLHQTP